MCSTLMKVLAKRDNETTLTARKLHTEVEQIALSIDSSSAAAEPTMGSIVHL